MRWMKRLAASVLAAGMALALLTACGSSKNDGVAPPVPTPRRRQRLSMRPLPAAMWEAGTDISNTVWLEHPVWAS